MVRHSAGPSVLLLRKYGPTNTRVLLKAPARKHKEK